MPPFAKSRSARALTLRHARRVLNLDQPSDPPHPSLPHMKDGEEQLLSFYAPSLTAGTYTVDVGQTVQAPTNDPDLKLSTKQIFTVTAPRFSLPDGAVHSMYPPQGHGDHVEILPHLVFNDEHLPWEREAVLGAAATSKDPRNRIPWLALFVFTPDEITIAADDLKDGGIFDGTGLQRPVVQGSNLEVKMTLDDIWKLPSGSKGHVVTPIPQNTNGGEPIDGKTTTNVVFFPPELFTSFFTSTKNSADLERYKYLSHVRNINATGMALSGGDGEDSGVFSVVISHRTGPTNNAQPTPVVVHLVSLEGITEMSFPLSSDAKYVAMTSLHSWNYTSLPPTADNIYQDLEDIGHSSAKGLLRAPDSIINSATNPKLKSKLNDGYTLVRYRTQTGEETAALLRGALTPTAVPRPLTEQWTSISNSSQDLQILDQDLGLMDITYSAAWQLGRTLGMGDRAFVSALTRLRGQIHTEATNASKAEVLRRKDHTFKTKEETLQGLRKSIQTLKLLGHIGPDGNHLVGAPGNMMKRRWQRTPVDMPDLYFGGKHIGPELLEKHALVSAGKLASSTDGSLYNEHNTPNSTDWMHVLKWVMDKLFLEGIPPQYLIPDPSYLPNNTIRFFTIDGNWTDAFIDGALSIANHSLDKTDRVRGAIKVYINQYLDTPLTSDSYKPQVPTHGFFVRSQAIVQFPDLIVKAPLPPGDKRAPLLRHENITSDVMFCLFDRDPGSSSFQGLTFQQPPHQQCFAAGAELKADELLMSYKRIYTAKPFTLQGHELTQKVWERKSPNGVYDWDTRTLIFPAWAEDVFNTLKTEMPEGEFEDTEPTAAMCGIQLNDPVYLVTIGLDPPSGASTPSVPSSPVQGASGLEHVAHKFLMIDPPRNNLHKDHLADLHQSRQSRRHPVEPSSKEAVQVLALPAPLESLRERVEPLAKETPRTPYHQKLLPITPQRRPTSVVRVPAKAKASIAATSSSCKCKRTPGPAAPPQFTYTVVPATSSTGPIATDIGPQDIVFGIILEPDYYYRETWRLQELHISLPLGQIDERSRNPAFAQSYRGPGATMLSNLRFNVAIEYGDQEIVFRLMPRSTTGMVAVGRCNEVSFIVGLMDVNGWNKETTVTMTVTEKWQWYTYVKEIDVVLAPSQ